jgi:hypothetical protein
VKLGLVERSGHLLAIFHRLHSADTRKTRDAAWHDMAGRVRTVFGDATVPGDLFEPAVVSRTLGDYHAGHVIITRDRQLAVIDPAADERYVFAARDIAYFLDAMLMAGLRTSSPLATHMRLSHDELTSAFLRGYDQASGKNLKRADWIAVDVCLAFLLKRRVRALATCSLPRLLYYAGPLLYRYHQVMSRLRADAALQPL